LDAAGHLGLPCHSIHRLASEPPNTKADSDHSQTCADAGTQLRPSGRVLTRGGYRFLKQRKKGHRWISVDVVAG
jgi:hypothetical protein